jgi:hypothetical protein
MGFLKQMMQLKAQAEQMQVAQQGAAEQAAQQAMAATAAPLAPAAGDFAPSSGVSLELYAEVSRGLAAYNYDQSRAVELAAAKGISPSDWQAAMDGWNARMSNQAVAQRFNALYTGRAV